MTLISPPATQAKPSTSMVQWLIAGGLIGAVAGVIIMAVAHNTAATIWGYTGLGLLVLGVLTAIAGLFIIAGTKDDPS
jgi:CDP-diglyceride synthetase